MIVLVAGPHRTAASLARQLWLRGFDASESRSPGVGAALEALELADAVVVDVDAPDFPGIHIIERLKGALPGFPVVALAADHRAAKAYLAGADAIVPGGIDATALAGELHRLIGDRVVTTS